MLTLLLELEFQLKFSETDQTDLRSSYSHSELKSVLQNLDSIAHPTTNFVASDFISNFYATNSDVNYEFVYTVP